ncbi:MAG: hypothetical protein HY815_23935 [Candidatus Riflebacteria bacterium]|nr:hypothetical protein [Candidatus Riflebacteria bacterium]
MSGKNLCLVLALGALILAPVAIAGDSAFAIFVNPVKNRVAFTADEAEARHIKDGKVEITSLTKVEADAAGDVLGQTAFFFPIAASALADFLASPEGACHISMFGESVTVTGQPKAGTWEGQMTVDLDKARSAKPTLRELYNPAAIRHLKECKERQYTTTIRVSREQADNVTTVRFVSEGGRLFTKAMATVRIAANGKEGSLVTVDTVSHSTIIAETDGRVQLAKQVLRSLPKILDVGLTRQGK